MRTILTLFILTALIMMGSLAFGGEIEVTVLDKETGEPISDAEVVIEYGRSFASIESLENFTGMSGTCAIYIPNDEPVILRISATAPGYLGRIAEWTHNYYQPDKKLTLPENYTLSLERPGMTIGGQIVDEGGAPIPEATISIAASAKSEGSEKSFKGLLRKRYELQSDYDGRWICEEMPAEMERMDLEFRHPSYINHRVYYHGDESTELDKLREQTHVVTLKDGLSVSGYVHDKFGNPIPGAEIQHANAIHELGITFSRLPGKTVSDENGWFSISGLKKKQIYLLIMAEGYASLYHVPNLDKDPGELDFTLEEGLTVNGVVQNSAGDSVSEAIVFVTALDDKNNFPVEWMMTTGLDGQFSYDRVPAKGKMFGCYHMGYEQKLVEKFLPDGTEHIILLEDQVRISGRVFDQETGQPVKRFHLYQNSPTGNWSQHDKLLYESEDGSYIYPFHHRNHIMLRVEAENYEPAESPGFKKEDGSIVYDFAMKRLPDERPPDFTGSIAEKYTNKPLEGVNIYLLDTDFKKISMYFAFENNYDAYRPLKATSDEEGNFKFKNIKLTKAALVLEKDGYARSVIRKVDMTIPLNVTMAAGAVIKGNVPPQQRKQATMDNFSMMGMGYGTPGISVQRISEPQLWFQQIGIDADGDFEIKNLPAGLYNIVTQGNNKNNLYHIADIFEGEIYTVNWDMPRLCTLTGSIFKDGEPVPEVHLSARNLEHNLTADSDTTGADGRFKIDLYWAGAYRIYAFQQKKMDARIVDIQKIIEIVPGVNNLDIDFGKKVTGKLVDGKTGEPIPEAHLQIYNQAPLEIAGQYDWNSQYANPRWQRHQTINTDTDGKFEMDNVTPGRWLCVHGSRYGDDTEMMDIRADKPFIVEVGRKQEEVLFKLPEVRPVRIKMTFKDGVQPIKPGKFYCVNQDGYAYMPRFTFIKGKEKSEKNVILIKDEEGRILFGDLPPGEYRAIAEIEDIYPTASASFTIPAEEENGDDTNDKSDGDDDEEIMPVDVHLVFEKGGRLKFRLPEDKGMIEYEFPWVGCRLSDAESGEPVLMNPEHGPYWGKALHFHAKEKGTGKEVTLPLPPGEYFLEAVFRNSFNYSFHNQVKNLWNYTAKITIEKGKDVIINIDL